MADRRPLPEKTCVTCGRSFAWRKKWERDWDAVRHCSDACRRRPGAADAEAEAAILTLLDRRAADASICPSEAARALVGDERFRAALPTVMNAARRLAARGEVEIAQGGRTVDPSRAKGPVRIRRPAKRGNGTPPRTL